MGEDSYELNPGSDEAIDENFKDIEGFEGRYKISNKGRVKSLRYYGKEDKEGFLNPRWSTTDSNNGRYASVRLINEDKGKDKQFRVHRLVAKHFIPNPQNKPEVNHINGNTEDNNVENLEWVTRSENQKHAIENDLANPPSRKNMGEKYAWENEDGRVFYGTPAQMQRKFDEIGQGYLYKMVNNDYESYKTYKGWKEIDIPSPGSEKAIDMGGTCPVLDNSHGEGWMGTDRYVVSFDCPLHGEGEL